MTLRLSVLVFVLLAPALAYGQAGRSGGVKYPDAAVDAPPESPDGAVEAHAPLPVTIYFKNGHKVRALLIRSTADSFLAEFGGRRHIIDALAVEGMLLETRKVDEYGNVRFNDEKARLDNYAIELQNDPSAKGYLICYAKAATQATSRCARARNYLVTLRGVDPVRVVAVNGGFRNNLMVELWLAPFGSAPPVANPTPRPPPVVKKKRRH